ncbi:glycosyltransferase 87 family protein [Kitasatospora sp. NPDC049285]|uniref:glycosyltransferase 87 family protein n=1 Tax=Kitasatospora sp. NPDC049285 TaxID=3157096 RepID=UPI00341F9296
MTTVQADRTTPPGRDPQPPVPAWRRPLTAPARLLADLAAALRAAPRRPLLAATALAALSLVAYATVRHFVGTSMVDMIVYRAEGAAVAHGRDLYAIRVTEWDLPATYPPFAAMLFVPTTWFGVPFLRIAVTAGNLALLALLAHLSFKLVGWPRREVRPIGVVLITGLGVWLEPVFTTLRYGQINLALACLILWDLTRPDSARTKGLAIGLAAGIKLTPGLFAVYLLITGRVRAAFVAGATFLGTFLIGALVLPDATRGFWTTYLFDSTRVGKTVIVDNQSLRGMVARLLHAENPGLPATALAAAVAVAGLAIAAWAHRSARWSPRAEAWSVCAALVTAVLISPISWTHHWVWCVPMLVLLAAEAAHERSRPAAVRHLRWRPILALTVLGFLSFGMWVVPHKGDLDQHLPALHQLPASVYPLLGLCFLAVAALRVRSRRIAAGAPLVRVPAQRPGPDGLGSAGAQKAPAAR